MEGVQKEGKLSNGTEVGIKEGGRGSWEKRREGRGRTEDNFWKRREGRQK